MHLKKVGRADLINYQPMVIFTKLAMEKPRLFVHPFLSVNIIGNVLASGVTLLSCTPAVGGVAHCSSRSCPKVAD